MRGPGVPDPPAARAIYDHQLPPNGLAGPLEVDAQPVLGALHHEYYLVDARA